MNNSCFSRFIFEDFSPECKDQKSKTTENFYVIKKGGIDCWIIECNSKKPTFLKTYPKLTLQSKIFSLVVSAIWKLSLQRYFFKKRKYSICPGSIYRKLSGEFECLGVFLGTPGVNRKLVVVGVDIRGESVYFKIPTSSESEELVRNEIQALAYLCSSSMYPHCLPQVVNINGLHGFTEVEVSASMIDNTNSLSRIIDFYCKLSDKTLTNSDIKSEVHRSEVLLDNVVFERFEPSDNCRKLYTAVSESIKSCVDLHDQVEVYKAHGDFTYWNIFINKTGISVLDWEMYGYKTKYFDIIHILVSHGILVRRSTASDIYSSLKSMFESSEYLVISELNLYLKLYLIQQVSYYLDRYSIQKGDLHDQVYWQIDKWLGILKHVENNG